MLKRNSALAFALPFTLLAGCEAATQSATPAAAPIELADDIVINVSFVGFQNKFSCREVQVDLVEDLQEVATSTNPAFTMRAIREGAGPGYIFCVSAEGDPPVVFSVATLWKQPSDIKQADVVVYANKSVQVTSTLSDGTVATNGRPLNRELLYGGWTI